MIVENLGPSQEAFDRVCKDLAEGNPLTYAHIGEVFGAEFWIMLVTSFLDAQDAARAIQGSIARLTKTQGVVEQAEGEDGDSVHN